MSTSDRPVRRTVAALTLAAVVGGGALSGCGTALPPGVSKAPVLGVVTALWPAAQAASLIGQGRVSVTDVVPAGADPFRYQLTAGQVAEVHRAGLAVQAGGGLQPSFESAAAGAPSVTTIGGGPSGPFPWLDPASMGTAVSTLASAMEKADPAAAPLYRRNAASLQAQISSMGIDYSTVLTTCPRPALIAPDTALGAMTAAYSIRLIVVASPTSGSVPAATAALRSSRTAAVITEPWVDNSGVSSVASAASAPTHPVDTLAGPPAGGWPRGADYFALMEHNLGTLQSILGCGSGTQ